jgi:hypothetical protein
MNQFLHLIPATGWRVRLFNLRDRDVAIRDVAAFALCKNGEVTPLIHILNGFLETPPPSSEVWAVDLLGPSDGDTTDLAASLLHTKLKSEAPLDKKLSKREDADTPQKDLVHGLPKDTRPIEIQILEQIDSSEREIDRGLDTERLMCRCGSDVLDGIERLRAEHLIFVDPVEYRGCDFYRLTDKARAMLRDFRNTQQTCL